jgi:hypothetical protein
LKIFRIRSSGKSAGAERLSQIILTTENTESTEGRRIIPNEMKENSGKEIGIIRIIQPRKFLGNFCSFLSLPSP